MRRCRWSSRRPRSPRCRVTCRWPCGTRFARRSHPPERLGPGALPGPDVIPGCCARRPAGARALRARGSSRPEAIAPMPPTSPAPSAPNAQAVTGEVEPERRVERHVTRAHGRETECDRREHERELEAAVLGPDPLPAVRGEGSRDHRGDQDRRGERHEEAERQQQAAEELSGSGERRVEPPGRSPSASKKPPVPWIPWPPSRPKSFWVPWPMKSTPGIACSAKSPMSNGIRLPYDS